jgi:hypothetical protein
MTITANEIANEFASQPRVWRQVGKMPIALDERLAMARGLNPHTPRYLTRSIVLG